MAPGEERGPLWKRALWQLPLPQKNGDLELEGPGMKTPLHGPPQFWKTLIIIITLLIILIIPDVCKSFTACTRGSQTPFEADGTGRVNTMISVSLMMNLKLS